MREENQLWGKKSLFPCVFIMNGGEWLEGEIVTNKTLPISSHCPIKLASTAGSRASSKMETIPFFCFPSSQTCIYCVVCHNLCVEVRSQSLLPCESQKSNSGQVWQPVHYALSHLAGAISVVEDSLFNSGRPATHANLLPQLPKCSNNRYRAGTSGYR